MEKVKETLKDTLFPNERKHLDASYSQLKRVPRNVARMKSLESLTLAGNKLEEIPPEMTRNMMSLSTVDLSGNLLTDLPPSFGANLSTTLQTLNLSYNRLSFLPYAALYELENLRHLDLSKNGITQITNGLKRLKRLETLKVNDNNIMLITEELNELEQLRNFDVSNNQLVHFPKNLNRLINLSHVNLSHNLFTEIPIGVGTMPGLYVLDLSYCRISKFDQEVVVNLKNLKELNLSHNCPQSITENLTELSDVQKFDMRGNEDVQCIWPLSVKGMMNMDIDWSLVNKAEQKFLAEHPHEILTQHSGWVPTTTLQTHSLAPIIASSKADKGPDSGGNMSPKRERSNDELDEDIAPTLPPRRKSSAKSFSGVADPRFSMVAAPAEHHVKVTQIQYEPKTVKTNWVMRDKIL